MDNVPIPPVTAAATLPRKSTFWIVGMIFISGFVASVIAGMVIAVIVLKNPNVYLYVYPLALTMNILGIRYGANYVAKKSLIYPNEIGKIAMLVGIPYLLLYLWGMRSGVDAQSLVLGIISFVIPVSSVWYFLKQRVK